MNPITRLQMSWALSQVRLRPAAALAVKLEKMANVIFQPRAVPAHVPQAAGYVHPALRQAMSESPWEVDGALSDHLDMMKGRRAGSMTGTVVEPQPHGNGAAGTMLQRRTGAATMLSPASKVSLWDRLRLLWSRGKSASPLPRLFKRGIAAMNPVHTGHYGGVGDAVATDATEALDDSGAESAGRPGRISWKSQGGSYEQPTAAVGAQGRSQRPSTTQAQGSAPATQAMAAPPVKLAAFFKKDSEDDHTFSLPGLIGGSLVPEGFIRGYRQFGPGFKAPAGSPAFSSDMADQLARGMGLKGKVHLNMPLDPGHAGAYAPGQALGLEHPHFIEVPHDVHPAVVAHEMGHGKVREQLGLTGRMALPANLTSNALFQAGGLAGSVGGAFGSERATAAGTAAMLPRLLDEIVASHHGGMANRAIGGRYLSAYRGVPTYLAAASVPGMTYGIRQWWNHRHDQ